MSAMFSNRGREGGDTGLPTAPDYGAPPPQNRLKAAPSVIGSDITITGNVSATAELQIDGRIDGDVRCGALTQGPDGRIKGQVSAESARLAGTVEGAVSVRNLVIASQAKIIGDVAYETIAIENGAHIDGRLKFAAAAASAPTPRAEAPRPEPMRLVSEADDAA